MWGRNVMDSVQKFLQFQLTVNVVALLITFLAAVLQQEPPLNPVMMLWVNLIMDTMGALALATEKPRGDLLHRKPYSSAASLILPRMWRHIFAQSALQLTIMLALISKGTEGLGITTAFLEENGTYLNKPDPATEDDVAIYRSTFIFNAFVFCQIVNEFNSRTLTDEWYVFFGLHKNFLFLAIIAVSAGLQAILVELGGRFVKTSGLTGTHWGYSIGLGLLSFPVGVLMRFIPVCVRDSDWAHTYSRWFYAAMDARAAGKKDKEVAIAPAAKSEYA